MKNRFFSLLAVLATAATLGACQGRTGSTQGGAEGGEVIRPLKVAVDTARLPAPSVEVACIGPERPRTSYALVRWATPIAARSDSVFLDYTVFKTGFDAGRYGTLFASGQETKADLLFRPATPLVAMELTNATIIRRGDSTVVRVERLDPGVNYLWRVRTMVNGEWVGGAVVRVPAPTCPFDGVERIER